MDDRLAFAAIHIEDDNFKNLLEVLTNSLQKSRDPLSVLVINLMLFLQLTIWPF